MSDHDMVPILNHFTFLSFTDRYWQLDRGLREDVGQSLLSAVRGAADRLWVYQSYPADHTADMLLWSVKRAGDDRDADRFFHAFAKATTPHRQYLTTSDLLWGFTRPSQYSKARSKQELDPFAEERLPYLIVYPFSKTTEWYLMAQESRQGMMNEHIRIGKQYTDITQLLLYSFGLQNQEFVVVYETDRLTLFSDLVKELRDTEARRYTLRDTPLHTAIYRSVDDGVELWR